MSQNHIHPRQPDLSIESDLPAKITKAGSKQTYYTFCLLADRDRVQAGLQSYAYFRWLDNLLDCGSGTKSEKVELIKRQQSLLEDALQGYSPDNVSAEEQMLMDLLQNDTKENSGLQIYLRNMMAVMAFDTERCGRMISDEELTQYTHMLSTAVTELLFYLIGHEDAPTSLENRYAAVKGAHVTHMLRDMVEDISNGYINIPAETLLEQHISIDKIHDLPFRKWVYRRVKLARQYFLDGRQYIAKVKSFRCRLAGFAYLSRFEWMIRAIEKDHYNLRPEYPERKSLKAGLWMIWRTFLSSLNISWIKFEPGPQMELADQIEER